jgi:hypothetical protein
MMSCSSCNATIPMNARFCTKCGNQITLPPHLASSPSVVLLRALAWMNLVAGVLGGFALLLAGSGTEIGLKAFFFGAAAAFAIQGVVGCALLLVVADAAHDVMRIRVAAEAARTVQGAA